MSKLRNHLKKACAELGLNVTFDEPIKIGPNHTVVPTAHIFFLGSLNGMLIFDNRSSFRSFEKELIKEGYGYSVLSEPHLVEGFDLASYKEMFMDWGWSGQPNAKPLWMNVL